MNKSDHFGQCDQLCDQILVINNNENLPKKHVQYAKVDSKLCPILNKSSNKSETH